MLTIDLIGFGSHRVAPYALSEAKARLSDILRSTHSLSEWHCTYCGMCINNNNN